MSGQRPLAHPGPGGITRIVLTGFMGAGKTTVGALLAERLRWRLIDTDRQVEERARMSVAEIFAGQGEAAFRELEAEAVRRAAAGETVVMALGGGALERPETRNFLASLSGCRVVFLDAPLEILLARCAAHAGGPERPVLRDRERLAERWRGRLRWYREAHLTVATADRTPEAVAECVLAGLCLDGIGRKPAEVSA